MAYNSWEDVRPQEGKQDFAFSLLGKVDFMLMGGARGGGKALTLQEPVLTDKGFVPNGELTTDHKVICPVTGDPIKILYIHPTTLQTTYRVKFSDGVTVDCSEEHQWNAWRANQHTKISGVRLSGESSQKTISTKQLKEWSDRSNNNLKNGVKTSRAPLIPVTVPCNYDNGVKHEYPTYLTGLMLGDGCMTAKSNLTLTTADQQIVDYVTSTVDVVVDSNSSTKVKSLRFKGSELIKYKKYLTNLGLYGCDSSSKFIPEELLGSSLTDRYSLLQGLLDTDGTVNEAGNIFYYTVSPRLAKDVKRLAESLGCTVTITSKQGKYTKDNITVSCKICYNVRIKSREPDKLFRLDRKRSRVKAPQNIYREVVEVEVLEQQPMRCITVDSPYGLYICSENYVVTHNSELLTMIPLMYAHDKYYRGIFFRRTYDEIMGANGLWQKAEGMYPLFDGKPNISSKTWKLPSDARQQFSHMFTEQDKESHRGKGYSFVGFDEIDQFSKEQVTFLMTCLRSEADMDSFMVGTLTRRG